MVVLVRENGQGITVIRWIAPLDWGSAGMNSRDSVIDQILEGNHLTSLETVDP
jgi:hypothetical protein